MFYLTFGLYRELAIVAISTVDNPDTFDLFGGEGSNLLLLIAYQPQATNATPIREGDVFPIRLDFPASLLVLHAPIVMLKLGIALLARLVVLAILIEAGDSAPGPIGRGLTSLGVERYGKGIFMGKPRTVALEVILVDAPRIHPQAQALIPDELHDPDSIIN